MKWYHLNWTIKWDKKSVYDMVMGVLVVHAIMSQFALWWKHYLYNSIWFLYLVHLTTPGNTSLFLKYRISPVFKWMAAVKEYWKRFKSIYFFFWKWDLMLTTSFEKNLFKTRFNFNFEMQWSTSRLCK